MTEFSVSVLSGLPEWWCMASNPNPDCDTDHVGLVAELEAELYPTHPLYETSLRLVAHDISYDDVIYQYCDDPTQFVEVHLTWSRHPEVEGCPSIECEGSWANILAFQQAVMAAINEANRLEDEGLRVLMGPTGTPSKPILVKPTAADLSGDPVLSEIETPCIH